MVKCGREKFLSQNLIRNKKVAVSKCTNSDLTQQGPTYLVSGTARELNIRPDEVRLKTSAEVFIFFQSLRVLPICTT